MFMGGILKVKVVNRRRVAEGNTIAVVLSKELPAVSHHKKKIQKMRKSKIYYQYSIFDIVSC